RDFHVTGVQTCALPISKHITGFERLSVGDTGTKATTVDMSNLGGINYVIANGTGNKGLLTLNNLQDGGTVQLAAATYTSGNTVKIGRASWRQRGRMEVV